MPKRKGYPSRYDRKQDAKIRKLEQNIVLKQSPPVAVSDFGIVASTMRIDLLNGVPQGETDETREGATMLMQSISIRWSIFGSAVPTIGSGSFRILLVMDTDPRAALPTALNMLTTSNLLSGYNAGRVIGQERSRGRFKFLYDETFDIINRPIASADSLPSTMTGKIFKKLNGTKTMFTADTGVIGVMEGNTLLLCLISLGNSQDLSWSFNSVLRFTAPD